MSENPAGGQVKNENSRNIESNEQTRNEDVLYKAEEISNRRWISADCSGGIYANIAESEKSG